MRRRKIQARKKAIKEQQERSDGTNSSRETPSLQIRSREAFNTSVASLGASKGTGMHDRLRLEART